MTRQTNRSRRLPPALPVVQVAECRETRPGRMRSLTVAAVAAVATGLIVVGGATGAAAQTTAQTTAQTAAPTTVAPLPVAAGSAVSGPVPVVAVSDTTVAPQPTTTVAPAVVADPVAEAAVLALAALKNRPAAVVPPALPLVASDPSRPSFDVLSVTTDPAASPPSGGVTVDGVPGLPAAAAIVGSVPDAYGSARLRLAQLVASRMKGVSAADLDAVWARTDPRRMTAVFAALSQVGTLYRYTGKEPGGFDCSGLTSWAWAQAGVKLPRISTDQINAAAPRTVEQLQPGDLVWRPGHITMSLGLPNLVVHSPQTGRRVQVNTWGRVVRFGSPVG